MTSSTGLNKRNVKKSAGVSWMKTAVRTGLTHMAWYLSFIYLLNPLHYIRQKEKTLYYSDAQGNIPFKPRLRERLANLVLSEKRRRKKILQWTKSRTPDQSVDNFTSSWHDGILLCALLESVLPGACPGYRNLKTHNRVNNCRLGIKLAHQYLQIPSDMLTPEEMAIADKRAERKIFDLISAIKWASENKSKNEIQISGYNAIVQPVSCCNVQGSGLKAGVVGRKMKFTVNISNVFGMFDLFLQLKGPRNEVYSEKIVSLHQSSDSILNNNKNKIAKRISPDQKVQTGDAKILAYLEDGHGNTYVRWKNVKQYGAHAVYNVFDFNCTCSKEGCFAMSFVPVSAGIHTLSIHWQDKHVEGSPFKVKVYKLSDVSRRGIAETRDKRVLLESLAMSTSFDGLNPSTSSFDHSDTKEISKQRTDINLDLKQENSLSQRMRKQYTITKRRILKKVIARNGEEIIITESPTPPLSRQSSLTDNSDFTDEEGGSIFKNHSRSSSPALLRAAKDITELRRLRSKSSSPCLSEKKGKTLHKPVMERIVEKVVPAISSASSKTSSSFPLTDTDENQSSNSDVSELANFEVTAKQISQTFLDSCLQSLAAKEQKFARQNSDSGIPQLNCGINCNPKLGTHSSKEYVLNRSLSESSLENNILKRMFVCAKGNVMSRDEADLESPGRNTGSPNLKLLHSGSLRKACFYMSGKTINQTQSIVSNDSRTDDTSFISGNRQIYDTSTGDNTKSNESNDLENTSSKSLPDLDPGKSGPNDVIEVEPINNNMSNLNRPVTKATFYLNELDVIEEKENNFVCGKGDKNMTFNAHEKHERCSVETWLEGHPSFHDKNFTTKSEQAEGDCANKTITKIQQNENSTIRRALSSDSKRGSLQKQSSVFPDADSDPSLDNLNISYEWNENEKIENNFLLQDASSNFRSDEDLTNRISFNTDSCHSNSVFRTIDDLKPDHTEESSTNVAIVMPKVKCDKGTTVYAVDIINETSYRPNMLQTNICRRRICVPCSPRTFVLDENENYENLNSFEMLNRQRQGRSFSIDACILGYPQNAARLRSNLLDRNSNVRTWMEQNLPSHYFRTHRQSTVETIDSGMGDDNGIKTGRRASLFSHFRFSEDNQHQTLCRRPYKGEISLDPKLLQSENNSETSDLNKCNNKESEYRQFEGEKDKHSPNANNATNGFRKTSDSSNSGVTMQTEQICHDSFSAQSHSTSRSRLDSSSSCDSPKTPSTQLSFMHSYPSSMSGEDLYFGFGVNQDERADLLSHLNEFQKLDAGLEEGHQSNNKDVSLQNSMSISPVGNDSCKETNMSTSSTSDISFFRQNISSLEDLTDNDNLEQPNNSQTEVPRYVSSIEHPLFLQLNDVIVKQTYKQTIDGLDDLESVSSAQDSHGDDYTCTADGNGLTQGFVGMKNNFQVWAHDPDNGSLSVTIYGPQSHSVLETCVVYTGDNLYEVIYEVKHPGIYIICVKWSEENIPNSPFTCRVTF